MAPEFDLEDWCEDVATAVRCIVSPALLPQERRKWERALAKLTTPEKCLYVSETVKGLINTLRETENELKLEWEKRARSENS